MSCHYYDELGHRCECFPSEVADKLTIASETIADLRDRNRKLEQLAVNLYGNYRIDHPETAKHVAEYMRELGIEV